MSRLRAWDLLVVGAAGLAVAAVLVSGHRLNRSEAAVTEAIAQWAGINVQIANEARGYLDQQANNAAPGAEKVAVQAFAACMQSAGRRAVDLEDEANLNRCEIEAAQLASGRGFELADAHQAIAKQRQGLAQFIADRYAAYSD